MMATVRTTSAEDLLAMPDDGFRYELIRGMLKKMTPAEHEHGRIAAIVTASLVQHVTANELGAVYAAETGFKLASNPDHVRAPDVAFIRRERLEQTGEVEGYWAGAPDLAVEVVSPNDRYTDIEDKVFDWLNAGTRMVIVVNPRKRAVTVYCSRADVTVLTVGDTLDGGDVVPGWKMAVKDMFG